jgi:putative aldouronate transport system substrate-binding protein
MRSGHREVSATMASDGTGLSRRNFLGTAFTAVGAAALSPWLVTACSSSGSGAAGHANPADLSSVLPRFVPDTGGPEPDLPSVTGAAGAATDPGFLKYPTDLVRTVSKVPGSGGSYTAITPLWGSIPAPGNSYYRAVNAALGAQLTVQPANGNNYAQTVPTLVAGNKLPDWLQIPTWWNANINVGELVVAKFADLTGHLAGDAVKKYPHLAAIPSGGWQAGAWQNRLYGIPSFTTQANFAAALFYRKDVFQAKGIDPASVNSADTLFALGKELTSTSANVWAFDMLWLMLQQIFKVPPLANIVTVVDGKATSAFETPQLAAALDFAYKVARSATPSSGSTAARCWSARTVREPGTCRTPCSARPRTPSTSGTPSRCSPATAPPRRSR